MLMFSWRWSRIGDTVLVHDAEDPLRPLCAGVVVDVERVGGDTRLGVRITEDGTERITWPARLRVHTDPIEPDESCWRCDEVAATTSVSAGRPQTAASAPKPIA